MLSFPFAGASASPCQTRKCVVGERLSSQRRTPRRVRRAPTAQILCRRVKNFHVADSATSVPLSPPAAAPNVRWATLPHRP